MQLDLARRRSASSNSMPKTSYPLPISARKSPAPLKIRKTIESFILVLLLFVVQVGRVAWAAPALVLTNPGMGTLTPLGIVAAYAPRWIDPVAMVNFGATLNITFSSPDAYSNGRVAFKLHFTAPGTRIREAWGAWDVTETAVAPGWYQIQPISGDALPLDANKAVYFSFNGEADASEPNISRRVGIDAIEFRPLPNPAAGTVPVQAARYQLDPNEKEFVYAGVEPGIATAPFASFVKEFRNQTVVPRRVSSVGTGTGTGSRHRPVTEQFFGAILVSCVLTSIVILDIVCMLWGLLLRRAYRRIQQDFDPSRLANPIYKEKGEAEKRKRPNVITSLFGGSPDPVNGQIVPREIYDKTRHLRLEPSKAYRDAAVSHSIYVGAASMSQISITDTLNGKPIQGPLGVYRPMAPPPSSTTSFSSHSLTAPSAPSPSYAHPYGHQQHSPFRNIAMETMMTRTFSPVGFARGKTPPPVPSRFADLSTGSGPAQTLESGMSSRLAELPHGLSWMDNASIDESTGTYTPRHSFDAVIEEEEEDDDVLWGGGDDEENGDGDDRSPTSPSFNRSIMSHSLQIALPDMQESDGENDEDEFDRRFVYGSYKFQDDDGDDAEQDIGFEAEEYPGEHGDDQRQSVYLPDSPLEPFPDILPSHNASQASIPFYEPRHRASMNSVSSIRSILRKRQSVTESEMSTSVPPSPSPFNLGKRVSFDNDVERREQEREDKLKRREERRERRNVQRAAKEREASQSKRSSDS